MANKGPHTIILAQLAAEILEPTGMWRSGSSRRWLCDCGYYLIEVEFQPNSWRKGTFCNVAISFLWGWPEWEDDDTDMVGWDACFRLCFSGRKRRALGDKQFAAYEGDDEAFRRKCRIVMQEALRRVNRFRRMTDLSYAYYHLNEVKTDLNGGKLPYHRSMLKKLAGAEGEGVRQWVIDGIARRREEIRTLLAYRRLPKTFTVSEPEQESFAESRSWKRWWRFFFGY